MQHAEECADPPCHPADMHHHEKINKTEHEAAEQVEHRAERCRAPAIARKHGAEEVRQAQPRETESLAAGQDRGQRHGTDQGPEQNWFQARDSELQMTRHDDASTRSAAVKPRAAMMRPTWLKAW